MYMFWVLKFESMTDKQTQVDVLDIESMTDKQTQLPEVLMTSISMVMHCTVFKDNPRSWRR